MHDLRQHSIIQPVKYRCKPFCLIENIMEAFAHPLRLHIRAH